MALSKKNHSLFFKEELRHMDSPQLHFADLQQWAIQYLTCWYSNQNVHKSGSRNMFYCWEGDAAAIAGLQVSEEKKITRQRVKKMKSVVRQEDGGGANFNVLLERKRRAMSAESLYPPFFWITKHYKCFQSAAYQKNKPTEAQKGYRTEGGERKTKERERGNRNDRRIKRWRCRVGEKWEMY